MINGIDTSSISQYPNMGRREDYKMTTEQKEKVAELLKNYDANSTDQASMKKLMDEIKELGVKPGEDLKNIMDEAGFKPPKPPEGGKRMPPPMESTTQTPSFVSDFLEKAKTGAVSQEDLDALYEQLMSNNMGTTGSIYDEKV